MMSTVLRAKIFLIIAVCVSKYYTRTGICNALSSEIKCGGDISMDNKKSVLLDDVTKLAGSMMDTAVHVVSDLKQQVKGCASTLIKDLNAAEEGVSREEFDVVRKMVQKSREEQEILHVRLAQLEKQLMILQGKDD